jgi:hypothetical protein
MLTASIVLFAIALTLAALGVWRLVRPSGFEMSDATFVERLLLALLRRPADASATAACRGKADIGELSAGQPHDLRTRRSA